MIRKNSVRRLKLMLTIIVCVLLAIGIIYSIIVLASSGKEEEQTIKLLGTIAMSGDAGNIGPAYDRAIKLAVKEINEMGIKGFSKIEYKVIDTESKPSVMEKKLIREVETWHPDVITGVAIEQTIRVLNIRAPEYEIPVFVGGHLGISKHMPPGEVPATKWVNYYGYADYFMGQLAGKFFHEMGVKKVCFFGGDFDWGYTNGLGLKSYWENNGKPFEISPVIYTPFDKTDYSTEALIIKNENPDALFCPYTGAGWFSVAKQLRAAGAMPKIFLYGTTYSNMGGAMITGEYGAENIYTFADHNPESDAWKEFVKKWKVEYGEKAYPEAYTNNHYQVVYFIKEIFEKAGTKDPDVVLEMAGNTSFKNVCISSMGPLGPYGSNLGASAAIIQFVPGAGELEPNFNLHPELIKIYETPKRTVAELLDEVKDMERLIHGKKYEMAK